MLKSLFALPLLAVSLFAGISPKMNDTYSNNFFVLEENARGNYTVTGVTDSHLNDVTLRIYYEENKIIDEVSDDAFASCTHLSSLMISKSVTYITDSAFIDSITEVNYTGSEEEFKLLSITKEFTTLNFYACDEGFINYWNTEVRPEVEVSICDMSKSDFQALYALYSNLTISDRKIVDDTLDLAGEKIGASMGVLINQFKTPQQSNKTNEWKQSGAITFIIIVAVIGMTSISIFFLLKTKQIIS